MEEAKQRIQKTGTILRNVCRIAKSLMSISIVLVLLGIIGMLFNDDMLTAMKTMFEEEGILLTITDIGFLSDLNIRYVIMISGLFHIFTRGILIFYLKYFDNILERVTQGNHPFEVYTAKRLRYISYSMLVFIMYNPLMGVLIFLVGMFFSYLFEYGAYLQERADEINHIQEEMIVSFAEITENKSEQTGQHIRRVAEYSKIIAQEMGLTEEEADKVRLASTMHDIGKLLISAKILEKPAKLTEEEFNEIKKHAGYGGMLLNSVQGDIMALAKSIAMEHHERVDGKGYPEGKKGDEISIEGRIVAVADVYDALTSKRSYKEAWEENRAYNEIINGSGTQFDASVVEAFKNAYEKINDVREKFADENH